MRSGSVYEFVRRLRDLVGARRGEPGRRAPEDVVADDAEVVARRAPVQGDAVDGPVRGQGARRGRRDGVARDRGVHVRLDLGGGEGAAVDPHLVDRAVEEPDRPGAVGADAPGVRVADVAGVGPVGGLHAVDVEAGGRAVEGGRDVLPLTGRGASPGVEVGRLRPVQGQVVAADGAVHPEHRAAGLRTADPGADDGGVRLRALLLHPRGEREPGVVEGAERRQVDAVVDAVEREGLAEAADGPRRADDRGRLAVPRLVGRRRPRPLVEAVGGDEATRRGGRAAREGRGGHGRPAGDVVPAVDGLDAERVLRAADQPCEGVARGGRRGDLRAAAVDVVVGDAPVVVRGGPRRRDRGVGRGPGGEVRRGGRGRHVGRADPCGHVRLDLGRRDGAVVDPHLVDDAVEEAAGRRPVGADPPDVRVADVARERPVRRLDPVHVEAGGRAVVGGREVLPLAHRRGLSGVEVVGPGPGQRQVVAADLVVDPDHRAAVRAAAGPASRQLRRRPSSPASGPTPRA